VCVPGLEAAVPHGAVPGGAEGGTPLESTPARRPGAPPPAPDARCRTASAGWLALGPRPAQECAVLGIPDELHGEVITALVVLKEGAAERLAAAGGGDVAAALRACCAERLPKYKVCVLFGGV
jgi:acyl-CoA synthetase (AMP-forming)/AMP-acid ligase II